MVTNQKQKIADKLCYRKDDIYKCKQKEGEEEVEVKMTFLKKHLTHTNK